MTACAYNDILTPSPSDSSHVHDINNALPHYHIFISLFYLFLRVLDYNVLTWDNLNCNFTIHRRLYMQRRISIVAM